MRFKMTERALLDLFDGNAEIYWDDISGIELEGEPTGFIFKRTKDLLDKRKKVIRYFNETAATKR